MLWKKAKQSKERRKMVVRTIIFRKLVRVASLRWHLWKVLKEKRGWLPASPEQGHSNGGKGNSKGLSAKGAIRNSLAFCQVVWTSEAFSKPLCWTRVSADLTVALLHTKESYAFTVYTLSNLWGTQPLLPEREDLSKLEALLSTGPWQSILGCTEAGVEGK